MRRWTCSKLLTSSALFLLFTLSGCLRSVRDLPELRERHAARDYCQLDARVPDEVLEVTLDDAICFALENNLDLVVQARQLQIQNDAFCREVLQILPEIRASSNLQWRNQITGAFSESLEAGIPPAPPSISSEQTNRSYQAGVTWNLLNIGVHIFRARQEADTTVARKMQYYRTTQDLIYNVVQNFWVVAYMERVIPKLDEASEVADYVKEKMDAQVTSGIMSAANVGEQLSAIYDLLTDAKGFRNAYIQSLASLKSLMGIPPYVELKLIYPRGMMAPEELPKPRELIQIALHNRPELYQLDLEGAAACEGVNEALVRMFPEIAAFIDNDYNANRFLIFNNWTTYGVRAVWNLLQAVLAIQDQKIFRHRRCLAADQRLLMTLSVMSQVHLAHALYYSNLDLFETTRNYFETRKAQYDLAFAERRLGSLGELRYAYVLAGAVYSEMEYARAAASVMATLEQLNNSIGCPRFIQGVEESGEPVENNDKEFTLSANTR